MKLRACLLAFFVTVSLLAVHGQHINSRLNSRLIQADSQGYYWMPTAVADDYFDGTSSRARVRRHLKLARDVGAKYLRCAFTWNAIENKRGRYNWRFWDMLVNESSRAGIILIPYVAYTPEWAAGNPDQFWKRPPTDPKLYAEFMYKIASRYRGRIPSWEIWNEPDIAEYWMGTPDQFAELVTLAAASIRRADPDATLVLAGMSKGPSPFFAQLIAKHHIDRVVDIIAMHGYPESWLEERAETVYQSWVNEMNALLDGNDSQRDFWLNEVGYADYRYSAMKANKYGVSAVFPHEHTRSFAATSLFKAQTMALASGRVSLTGWYRIDDFDPRTTKFSDDHVNFHLGLMDARHKPKPTFLALKFFNQLFSQPTRAIVPHSFTPSLDSDAVLNVFQRKNGDVIVVGWLRSLNRDETDADGHEADLRHTSASVELPCASVSDVKVSDAQGHLRSDETSFQSGWLSGISLSPDEIFVAEMNCSTTPTTFSAMLQ
jgi:hypothetical protein